MKSKLLTTTSRRTNVLRDRKGMRIPLGTFQYLVLCAIKRLGPQAFALEIKEIISVEFGIKLEIAHIYVTTIRLTKLGFLVLDKMETDFAIRPVQHYRVTPEGEAAMRQTGKMFAAALRFGAFHSTEQ